MARSDNVLELIIEAIDRTAPGFSKVTARMAKLTQEFPVLSAAAGLAAQAIVGQLARIAAGLVDSYNEVVKVGAALDDMTKRIDLSAEKLSSWEYVMQTSGGTLGNFESGVTKLREQMAAVAGGSKEATKKFSDLGVSAKDAYGNLKPVEAVLLDISTALKGATSDSVKMAAANTLLGGEKALVGSLAEGPEEIQRKLRLVQALNGEMSAEFAKSSSAVADAQTNLSFAWRGLKSDVAQAVNWDAALAANKLAMVVAAVSGHLDDLERMMEDTREALKEPLFPGVAAYNQGPDVMLKNMETANREALVRAAAEFKVSAKKTVFDPKTFKFIDVDKTAEQIAADITAARERGIQQARSQAERDEAAETRRRERIRLEQIKDFKITGRPDAPVNTRALGPPEPKDQPITDFEQLKLDLKDMTEFSAREFANMALNIGDTFADVVSDVGAHLLGLREGPMMIGRAFKAMAASIMAASILCWILRTTHMR